MGTAYEEHYAAAHVNVCSVCHRKMPTCRLLSLHVQEAHDSFFAVHVSASTQLLPCLACITTTTSISNISSIVISSSGGNRRSSVRLSTALALPDV